MSDHSQMLRIGKIKSRSHLKDALLHNLREIPTAENVDRCLSHQNILLVGKGSALDHIAKFEAMLEAYEITRMRKDAVLALEVIISLPIDSEIDHSLFFDECLAWIGANFGGMGNVLSFVIHLDERQKHSHALVIPISIGRLCANDFTSGDNNYWTLGKRFHADVAEHFGLKLPKKLSIQDRNKAQKIVMDHLIKSNDSVVKSACFNLIRNIIKDNPETWLNHFGLQLYDEIPETEKSLYRVSKASENSEPYALLGFQSSPTQSKAELPVPEGVQVFSLEQWNGSYGEYWKRGHQVMQSIPAIDCNSILGRHWGFGGQLSEGLKNAA